MTSRICSFIVIVTLICGFHSLGFGQSSHKKSTPKSKEKHKAIEWVDSDQPNIDEINFMGGYSFHSTKGFWGKIPDATLRLFSLRYNRKLLTYKDQHVLEYVTELNVAANYTLSTTPRYREGTYTGVGISPIGFQLNFLKEYTVQPFLKSSGGFMYFSKRFPDDRGVRFNFTLELGGGLEFVLADNISFTLGYKYHHMSNGHLGNINPGIDSNVFYTGITIF